MADDKRTINDEAGLGPNWVPVDAPPIIPGRPSAPSPNSLTPSVPQYLQGSISPTFQHDADFVHTATTTPNAPKLSLMPLGIQANPATNAAIQSTIINEGSSSSGSTADDDDVLVNEQTGTSYTVQQSDFDKLVSLTNNAGGFLILPPITGGSNVITPNNNTVGTLLGPVASIGVAPSSTPINVGDFAFVYVNMEPSLHAAQPVVSSVTDDDGNVWVAATALNGMTDLNGDKTLLQIWYTKIGTQVPVGDTLNVSVNFTSTLLAPISSSVQFTNIPGLLAKNLSAIDHGTVSALAFNGSVLVTTDTEVFLAASVAANTTVSIAAPFTPIFGTLGSGASGGDMSIAVTSGSVFAAYTASANSNGFAVSTASFLTRGSVAGSSISALQNGFFFYVQNTGIGTFQILSDATIDGSSVLPTIPPGSGLLLVWSATLNGWFTERGSGGGGTDLDFYQTVQQAGAAKTQEPNLNFLAPITATDNSGNSSTDIKVPDFVGDSGSGGVDGLVPAPAAGDAAAGKFLKASGGWAVPTAGFATQVGVQDESYTFATDTGAANAYAIAPSPAIAAYVAGQRFQFVAANANTTASTLVVSGLAAKAITKDGTTALVAGDIPAGAVVDVVYDGTQFQMVSSSGITEFTNHKDAASGYAGLDANTKLKLPEQATAVDARTTTSEAITDSDRSKVVTFSNTSAIAATIAQAGAGGNFAAGWYCDIINLNTGTVTLTPTTSTINGLATLVLQRGEGGRLVSDGSNYLWIAGQPTTDTPNDADVLTYVLADKRWESKSIGTIGGANASELRGNNISSATPIDQQVLKWSSTDNQYDLVFADGMRHGDAVWPVDSGWAGMRDDFNACSINNLISTTNLQTNVGELGWAHFGTQLSAGELFMGGNPPHMGIYTFHTNQTFSYSGLMLNLRDPVGVGSYFFNMKAQALLENPGWKMSWIFKFNGDLASSGTNTASFHKKSFYIGLCGAPMNAVNPNTTNNGASGTLVSPRPDYFIGLRYDTSHTPQSWGLNTVAAASAGTTAYTPNATANGGGFQNGATNTYKGCTVVVSGCTNAANNGTFTCTASSATTITLNNAAGVVETVPENAIIRITNINITAVTANSPAAGQCTMTYVNHNTDSPGANGGYIGQSFTGSGFTNAGNNVTATCIGSTATTIILNIAGVTETPTANAAFLAVTDSPNDDATGTFKLEAVQNPQYGNGVRHNVAGTVVNTSITPSFGNWYRLDMSCTTAGQVVVTLYDENNNTNFSNTFTISQVALSTGSITFATDANKMLNIAPTTSASSSGVPTIQCMPFAAGSKVAISGLTGGAGTDFNGNWTLEAASDRAGGGNWTGWIYTNNASVSFAGQTGTLTGYAAYAPICIWGTDDSGATGAGTTWPTPSGLSIDFFSMIWNKAIASPSTAPTANKSRYW